jgi:hypothetical protein
MESLVGAGLLQVVWDVIDVINDNDKVHFLSKVTRAHSDGDEPERVCQVLDAHPLDLHHLPRSARAWQTARRIL